MAVFSSELTSPGLTAYDWLRHGFGTRTSKIVQDAMARLKQIHSARVLKVTTIGEAGEGDALITNTPGVPLSIRTADCYPILLADPDHRAIAAIHAGWRGTAAQIVKRTLEAMQAEFGTSPHRIAAAIGPGIGACCYEVSDDVSQKFGRSGTKHLDLAAINREQLETAGVPQDRIEIVGACTRCDAERFHSYRRDGDQAGRMISYITIK